MSETRVALAVFLLISGINFFGIAYLIREVNALVVELVLGRVPAVFASTVCCTRRTARCCNAR